MIDLLCLDFVGFPTPSPTVALSRLSFFDCKQPRASKYKVWMKVKLGAVNKHQAATGFAELGWVWLVCLKSSTGSMREYLFYCIPAILDCLP